MRNIILAAFIFALAPAASPWAQELVIFQDYRSLQVQSHRVSGNWTYLRLSEGEFAVLTKTIREFRKETASPSAGPVPVASPAPQAPAPPPPRDWRPEPPPPQVEPDPSYDPGMELPPDPVVEEPPPSEEPTPPPPPEQVKPYGRPDIKRATIGRALN